MHLKSILCMLIVVVMSCAHLTHADDVASGSSSADTVCGEHRFKGSLTGSSSQKFKTFQSDQWTPEEESRQKEMQSTLTEMRDETWDDRYRH